MAIIFPINPLHGQQYASPGIPITWQFDAGRNAWRVMRGGTAWNDIVGKPAEFPPSDHNHPISDVTGLQDILNVKQDISARGQANGYAPLDSDARVPPQNLPFGTFTGDWDDITDKPAEFPPSAHTHPVAQISDSGTTGQQVVRAPTAFDARQAIGAIGVDDNARVTVKKEDAIIGVRRAINFIEGTNVALTITDDPAAEEVDVTINSSGGTGGGGTALTVSEIKPVAPFANDMWLDVATGITFVYYNDGNTSQWIEPLPYLDTMPAVFTKFDFPPAPINDQLYNPIPGATWKWSSTRGVWFAVGGGGSSGSYTKAEADSKFVDIVGDVMTGPLSVVHPPTANTHAASKQYVDNRPGLTVSDTPPAGAPDGALWWESDSGLLYVRYNDGSSTQWVIAAPQPDFTTYAPLASPAFTGVPTAPTRTVGDNGISIATTAFVQTSVQSSASTIAARNRFVNGAMQVSQERGYAASSTTTGLNVYMADMWNAVSSTSPGTLTAQRIALATPNGSPDRYRITVGTAKGTLAAADKFHVGQAIEGYRISDFRWGSASAKSAVVRFGLKAPAGTYGITIRNNSIDRSYVTTFVVSAAQANTDVERTIVIPGDTLGVWATTTSVGFNLDFMFACGTTHHGVLGWQAGNLMGHASISNGMATAGNVFELYDCGFYMDADNTGIPPRWEAPEFARELILSQRYWIRLGFCIVTGNIGAGGMVYTSFEYPVQMRANPTVTYSGIQYSNASGLVTNNVGVLAVQPRMVITAAGYGYAVTDITCDARI